MLAASVSDHRRVRDVQVFEKVERPVSLAIDKAIYSTAWDGDIVIDAWSDGCKQARQR